MRSFHAACRRGLTTLVLAFGLLVLPSPAAEPEAAAVPWQDVISGQIQAFRDRDAPAAFGYAGAAFQVGFQNAEIFFESIVRSGYAPIVDSHSHSFGDYQMVGGVAVLQQVTLVGNDQQLYQAIYQLLEEPGGWRVQGVQLFRQQAMAI